MGKNKNHRVFCCIRLKQRAEKRLGTILVLFFVFLILGLDGLYSYNSGLTEQASLDHLARPIYWKYLEALKGKSSVIERRISIQRLSEYPYPEVILALMGSLEERDEITRLYAKRALLNLGRFAVPYLGKGLESLSSLVRLYSAEILGEMGEKRFLSPLIGMLLSDKDWKVRKSSAYALGLLKASVVGDSLVLALKDPEALVRAESALSLRWVQTTPKIVRALCSALSDENSYVRLRSAASLGYIGKKEALPFLLVTLQDGNMEIREISAWALGKIRDPRSIKALSKTLKHDPSALVRQSAHVALKKIGAKLE